MLKNKSLFLKSILVVFVLLLVSTNVFAYSTKKTDAYPEYREDALKKKPEDIVNLEIEDVSIKVNEKSECIVMIQLSKDIKNHRTYYSYPHFIVSIPFRPRFLRFLYSKNMYYFYNKENDAYISEQNWYVPDMGRLTSHTVTDRIKYFVRTTPNGIKNGVASDDPKYTKTFAYLIKMDKISDWYWFKLPKEVGDDLCINRQNDGTFTKNYLSDNDEPKILDVYAFIAPRAKLFNTDYGFEGTLDNVYYYNAKPGAFKLWKHIHSYDLLKGSFDIKEGFKHDDIDYFYNLDYAYDVPIQKSTTPKATPTITTAPTNLSCDKCQGYKKSNNYPNRTFGDTKYNPGSLCYRCNDDGITATTCDPATGNILYRNAKLTKALKNEICPEIEINVELPDISPEIEKQWQELVNRIEPPTLPTTEKIKENSKLKEIETPIITPSLFDCASQKTPLEERLKLKYNNNNAKYTSSENQDYNALLGNIVTLSNSQNNVNIEVADWVYASKYSFIQTEDFATSCLLIPDNRIMKSLLNSDVLDKYYIKEDSGIIVNGEVISTLNIKSDKLELCINRPVTTLTDSERLIQKTYQDKKNKNKIFTIKQKRKWWFDKKIAEFTITLDVNLIPLGCIDKSKAIATAADTSEFISKTATEGTCYNPHGTEIAGLKGEENYLRYGFDKLNFNYDKYSLLHNTFDYGESYPDQDQLKYALSLKGELLEKKDQTILLDGVTFSKSPITKGISPNYIKYFDSYKISTQAINLLLSDFKYSSNPEIYYTTIISTLNKIPEELSKFVILDIKLDDSKDNFFLTALTETEIKERINKISGGSYFSYTPQKEITDTTNYYGYQITMYSFLRNQELFKKYLESKSTSNDFKISDLVFLKQLIENIDIYYGDSLTPVLINTKTYGSLEKGLTKDIFESVKFMDNINKKIKLATDSEIKKIDTPGLYVFDLELDGKGIKYKVRNTDIQTRNIFDYYNLSENAAYKQNSLFTNPINAMYFDYGNLPFRLFDGQYGVTSKKAIVYKDFSDWSKIQDGYVLSFKFNTEKILEVVVFKDIRPIQINAPSGYSYKYIKKDGSYSGLVNKNNTGKDTLFVFLENNARDPQLVITSNSRLSFNYPLSPIRVDGKNAYYVPNSLKSENSNIEEAIEFYKSLGEFNYSDSFSGIETEYIGFFISLIKRGRTCFNIKEGSINFWLNPELTIKK